MFHLNQISNLDYDNEEIDHISTLASSFGNKEFDDEHNISLNYLHCSASMEYVEN